MSSSIFLPLFSLPKVSNTRTYGHGELSLLLLLLTKATGLIFNSLRKILPFEEKLLVSQHYYQ